MQKSTRYQNAALGVDFQMHRHNIIADIVRWSIPEKKKITIFGKCQRSSRPVDAVWQSSQPWASRPIRLAMYLFVGYNKATRLYCSTCKMPTNPAVTDKCASINGIMP